MNQQLWRQLPYNQAPIAEALAAADAMLAGLPAGSGPTLRWYGAAGPGLVLGAAQRFTEVDMAACRALATPVYKRASGGTAVLFAPGFVMQDLALPTWHPFFTADVTESYRWYGEVWVAALAELGVAARLVTVAEARADQQALDALERRACFGGRSPYEVLAGERKLVGFSQIRRREGALFQAGLYVQWAPADLAALLNISAAERTRLTERLQARVVGLAELRPGLISPEPLFHAFAEALAAREVVLAPAEWTAVELAAYETARVRYQPLAS